MTTEKITIPVDTRQLERAIKLTKELIDLGKKANAIASPNKARGRTLDKTKGRTL